MPFKLPPNIAKPLDNKKIEQYQELSKQLGSKNPLTFTQQGLLLAMLEGVPKECHTLEKKILGNNKYAKKIVETIAADNSNLQEIRLKHYLVHDPAALAFIVQNPNLRQIIRLVLLEMLEKSPLEKLPNEYEEERLLAKVSVEAMTDVLNEVPANLKLNYLKHYLIHNPLALSVVEKVPDLYQIIKPILLDMLAKSPMECKDDERIILTKASEKTVVDLIITTASEELRNTYLKHYLIHNPAAIAAIETNAEAHSRVKEMLLAILAQAPQEHDDHERGLFTQRSIAANILEPEIQSLTSTQLINYLLYNPTYFNKLLNENLQQPLLELLAKEPSHCSQYEKALLAEPKRAKVIIAKLGSSLQSAHLINLIAHCPAALIQLKEYKDNLAASFFNILNNPPNDFTQAEKSIIANPKHIAIILKFIKENGKFTTQHLQNYAMGNGVALIAILNDKKLYSQLMKDKGALTTIAAHYEVQNSSNKNELLNKLKTAALEHEVFSHVPAKKQNANEQVSKRMETVATGEEIFTKKQQKPIQQTRDISSLYQFNRDTIDYLTQINPSYFRYLTAETRALILEVCIAADPTFDWNVVYTAKERKQVLTGVLGQIKTELMATFSAETNKLSTQAEVLDKVAVASQALKTRLFTRGVIGNVYRTKLCTDKDLIKEQQNWFPLACLSADTQSGLLDFIKNSRSKVNISGSDLIHLFAYTSKNKPKLPADTYTGILNQGIFFWNIGKKFSKALKSLINNCKPGRVSPDVLEKLRSILGNDQLRGYLNLKKSPELVKKLAEINDPILDEILAKDEALGPLLTDKDKYQFFKELPEGSWLDKALDATIDNGQFEKYILTKYPFIISKILQDATAEQLNELVGKQAEIKSFVLANDELVTKWTQAYEFDAADYLKQSLIPTSGYKFNHLPKKQYKAAAKDIDSAVLNQLVKVSDAKIPNSLKLNFIKVALKKNPQIKPAEIQLPDELALNFVNNTDFTVNHKFFSLVENHFTQADFCKAVKDKAAAKLIAGGYLTENQLFTQEQLAKIWVLPEITLEHVGKKCFESLFETSEFIIQLAMRNLDLLLSKIINQQGNLLPQAKSHFIDWLKSDNYTPLNTFLLRANTASLITQNPEILTDIIDEDCDLALGLLTAAETNTQLTWLINPLMAFTSQATIQVVFAEVLSQEQNLANLSQFLASTKPEIKNLIELLAKNVPSFSLKIVEAASIDAINTNPLLYITCIKNSEFATQFSTPVIENLLQATKIVRDEIIEQILSGNLKQKSAIAKRLLASDKIKPSHEDRAIFECLWKPKLQELDIEQIVKLLAIPEAKTVLLKDATTCRNLLSSEQDMFTANDEELIQHLWEEQSELAALDVNQCLKLLKLGIAKASIAILNKPGLFELFSAEQLIELLKFKDESVSNAVLAKPVCCLKLINFIAKQAKEFEFTNEQAWLMFCHNDELRDTLYGIDKLRKQVLGFVDTLSNSKLGEQEKAAQSYILTKRIESLQKGEPAAVAKLSHIVTKILSSATQPQLDSFLSIDAEGHLEIREVVINELKTQLDEKSLTDLNQLNSIILPVILRDENLRKTIYPALEFAELVQIPNKEIAQWLFNHSEGFARLEPDDVSDLLTDPYAKEFLSLAVIKLGDTEKPYLIRYFEEKLAKKETTLIQLKVALKNLLAVADFRHELADNQDYAEFKQYVVTIFKAKSFEDLLKPQQLSIANSRFGSFAVKILANNNDFVSSLPVINPKPADELETKVYTL